MKRKKIHKKTIKALKSLWVQPRFILVLIYHYSLLYKIIALFASRGAIYFFVVWSYYYYYYFEKESNLVIGWEMRWCSDHDFGVDLWFGWCTCDNIWFSSQFTTHMLLWNIMSVYCLVKAHTHVYLRLTQL